MTHLGRFKECEFMGDLASFDLSSKVHCLDIYIYEYTYRYIMIPVGFRFGMMDDLPFQKCKLHAIFTLTPSGCLLTPI